jgi:nucleoside 2-deoxyribosyltransferase
MTVYLCGPINGRSDADCLDWRTAARALLTRKGVAVLDPMARDYRGRELEPGIAREIVENDIADVAASDALLVYYDKPSVGTSMEILLAAQAGKRVVLIDASGKPLSPWLLHHVTQVVTSVVEGVGVVAA